MLNVGLRLEVGWLKGSRFVPYDVFDFELSGSEEWDCDNINDLIDSTGKDLNYAQLKFYYNTQAEHSFLVGTFRRIRLRGKGHKWVLTD